MEPTQDLVVTEVPTQDRVLSKGMLLCRRVRRICSKDVRSSSWSGRTG